MLRKWIIIVTLVLLSIATISPKQVAGQLVAVSVDQSTVTLNMDLVLSENLTALPIINTHVSLANSTSITQQFLNQINNSIQSKVPTAHLAQFILNVKTSNKGNTWVLEESYNLTILGANTNSGSHTQSNLAFLTMAITQPLALGSMETNGVGATYLLPALDQKAANYTNLIFFIDGSQTRNSVIPDQTTKQFWLLDFSWVPPVSTWMKTTGTLDQTSHWTLTPNSPRYNLTLGVPSPEGVVLASYVAIYNPSLSLSAPAHAWIDNSVLSFDAPSLADTIGPIIILVLAIILIVTLVLNRKVTRPIRRARKR